MFPLLVCVLGRSLVITPLDAMMKLINASEARNTFGMAMKFNPELKVESELDARGITDALLAWVTP